MGENMYACAFLLMRSPAVNASSKSTVKKASLLLSRLQDYRAFYQLYQGQRKLPPPVDGRTLYSELPGLFRPPMPAIDEGSNGIPESMLAAFQHMCKSKQTV